MRTDQSAPKTINSALNWGSFPSCHLFEEPAGPKLCFPPLKNEVSTNYYETVEHQLTRSTTSAAERFADAIIVAKPTVE